MKLTSLFCHLIIAFTLAVECQYQPHNLWPEVRLPQGLLRGRSFRTSSGREYLAFLGIPFATPPLGRLRFKAPVPATGWSHVLTASSYKDPCPQFDSRATELGNEDCLYLNVYTPTVQENVFDARYPVMVYIQAESFENGDSSLYGPEKLLEKDVVVVTFNYRLGILGFLSTGDDAASGNWGLHDQRLVLEWVKGNIDSFSGDPNRVTLFGQGAGAASVVFHLLSPSSRGLFHRAIAQSGSALCDWATEKKPLQFARDVAESLGCPTTSTQQLVECLRTMSPTVLLRAQSKFKTFGEFPQRAAPVIETPGSHRFISEDVRTMLEKGNVSPVPLMIGANQDETSYFYPMIVDAFEMANKFYHEKELIPRFLEATTDMKGQSRQKVMPSILFTYFNGVDLGNLSSMANRFINMSSDALYNSCIDETVKLYWQSRAPVFQYVFQYKGQNSMVNLLVNNNPTLFPTGVCHGDELFYLFNLRIVGLRPPSYQDNVVSNRLVSLWTDFAKYGWAPKISSREYPQWDRFDPDNMKYYSIGSELSLASSYKQQESYFWSHHLRNISGLDPQSLALTDTQPILYRTLAWSMIAVSVALMAMIIVLLAILYAQRRKQTFRAETPLPSHLSGTSTLY